MGSGGGSVGRAVTSNSRGLQFESSDHQKNIEHLGTVECIKKTKITKTRLGMAHLKNTSS